MTLTTVRMSSDHENVHFCNHFLIIQSHYACKICSNYPGITLEPVLQRYIRKKTKLKICRQVLTLSTQPQNRSFHNITERTRIPEKCPKLKNARTVCQTLHCQTCKFVTFLLPSSSWLLKLPNKEQLWHCKQHLTLRQAQLQSTCLGS